MKTLIFILLFPLSAFAQCQDDNSFDVFFLKFREAIKMGDAEKAAKLTQFPLKMKSKLDSDTPEAVSKKQFLKYFKYMMKLESTPDAGGKGVPQKDIFLRDIPYKQGKGISCISDGNKNILSPRAEIGVFVFTKNKRKEWHLSGAFLGSLAHLISEGSEPLDDSWVKD